MAIALPVRKDREGCRLHQNDEFISTALPVHAMSKRNETYVKYLASDHWEMLRGKAFAIAEYRCEVCTDERSLVGHHLVYRDPLERCTVADIMCLCETCHNALHRWLTFVNRKECDYDRAQSRTVMLRLRSGGCPPPEMKFVLPSPIQHKPTIVNPGSLWEIAQTLLSPQDFNLFKTECGGKPTLGKGKWNHAVKILQRKTGKRFVFLKDCPKGKNARAALAIHRSMHVAPQKP